MNNVFLSFYCNIFLSQYCVQKYCVWIGPNTDSCCQFITSAKHEAHLSVEGVGRRRRRRRRFLVFSGVIVLTTLATCTAISFLRILKEIRGPSNCLCHLIYLKILIKDNGPYKNIKAPVSWDFVVTFPRHITYMTWLNHMWIAFILIP